MYSCGSNKFGQLGAYKKKGKKDKEGGDEDEDEDANEDDEGSEEEDTGQQDGFDDNVIKKVKELERR